MRQKQSQRVVVNINQAIKGKRKKRPKKTKARTQLPTIPPFYSPMPQSVIRYYDNPIPQRNITFNPPLVEQPKILGVPAETEYAQPVRTERKPVKVSTPLPETEHVLLREEEPVLLGGEETPTARDVIEEQSTPEEKQKKKKKKETRELPEEFRPTFTQAIEPFPLPPKFAPVLQPVENELEKGAEERKPRKPREPEEQWFKAVKKEFNKANEDERLYEIDEIKLTPTEAKRRYDRRRTDYIQSIGQNVAGFSFATPPVPKEASGEFSFV